MKLLEMKNIVKSFYDVVVVDKVNLEVAEGEIHALIGENGAGKTTLMNVLGGVLNRDSGELVFDGISYDNMNPKLANSVGIGFVHQELNLINDLLVYENIFFGNEIVNGIKLNKTEMVKQTKKLFDRLQININPNTLVDQLDASNKQLVEIAKVLHQSAKLVILDEPTTSLNTSEIKRLFTIINNLKKQGTAFIYISHKMPEIFEICDTYTVLRNGLLIESGFIKDTDTEKITKKMVGGAFVDTKFYKQRKLGEVVLDVKNLCGEGFEDVSFSVQKGEVLVLTGLEGSGTSDVIESIFGIKPWKSGSVESNNQMLRNGHIHNSMKNKIALVPRNRKENGLLPDLSIQDNMNVSKFRLFKGQVIKKKYENIIYNEYKKLLNIKAENKDYLITSLSGGNQQKVIISRWLSTESNIFIFDNPTQGVDVGAKAQVYELIMKLASEGKTVIVNTLEIPELQKIADRCIVFYHGKVVTELNRNQMSEENVMMHATNAMKSRGN
ncbi:MAG: sugar ABC transporter ATP-binding protein [Acholeplasmataceae bacterium]|nr:sugar ABC transporter ATP-binding protein [Acholeplasmataceae bacterium]